MGNLEDKLIPNLFDQMCVHKPNLSKGVDTELDEDISISTRKKEIIIKNFPWPISNDLMRYFSIKNPDRAKLDQIFKIIERTTQFISFVMLSQLLDEVHFNKYKPPYYFCKKFSEKFFMLTFGNILWFIKNIDDVFREYKISPFMIEMTEILTEKFQTKLDDLKELRNDMVHNLVDLNQSVIAEKCFECEEKLFDILQSLSFLIKYKLMSIKEITVFKPKWKAAKFNHTFEYLNTRILESENKVKQYASCSDSNSVLLMKDISLPHISLNLSPLIIDTRSEFYYEKDKSSIQQDIFLYTKFIREKNEIRYAGTKVTETCDLTRFSCYQELLDQFNQYLTIFAPWE